MNSEVDCHRNTVRVRKHRGLVSTITDGDLRLSSRKLPVLSGQQWMKQFPGSPVWQPCWLWSCNTSTVVVSTVWRNIHCWHDILLTRLILLTNTIKIEFNILDKQMYVYDNRHFITTGYFQTWWNPSDLTEIIFSLCIKFKLIWSILAKK